jgi:RimJ/RimL family protein N-acetyltransferase
MTTELYDNNLRLFDQVLLDQVTKYPNFLHLRGIYKDEWYNFIVPSVTVDQLDFSATERLIKKEAENGYKVSYYIPVELNESYENKLKEFGYDFLAAEQYIRKEMKEKYLLSELDIEQVNEATLESYLEASVTCFHDWPSNKEYSEKFFEIMNNNPYDDKEFNTYVGNKDGKVVSYGSIIIDHNAKLGYLHNSGTLKEYRRQGFHSEIVKRRCNWAFDKGIKEIYAIVEEDSASFKSLSKLGFGIDSSFFIYSKD